MKFRIIAFEYVQGARLVCDAYNTLRYACKASSDERQEANPSRPKSNLLEKLFHFQDSLVPHHVWEVWQEHEQGSRFKAFRVAGLHVMCQAR
jgi:hypothetical protein